MVRYWNLLTIETLATVAIPDKFSFNDINSDKKQYQLICTKINRLCPSVSLRFLNNIILFIPSKIYFIPFYHSKHKVANSNYVQIYRMILRKQCFGTYYFLVMLLNFRKVYQAYQEMSYMYNNETSRVVTEHDKINDECLYSMQLAIDLKSLIQGNPNFQLAFNLIFYNYYEFCRSIRQTMGQT